MDTPKSGTPGDKFAIPPEWRVRCEVTHLTPQVKGAYLPLQNDLLRCLLHIDAIDFKLFLVSGWDLVEFIKPSEFSAELIKELFEIHKKWPTQTKICVERVAYPRYERIAAKFRRERFVAAADVSTMAFEVPFQLYTELSDASQTVVRGALGQDNIYRVSRSTSNLIGKMCSTRDAVQFLCSIVAKDPVIYDHAAVTAFLSGVIVWNVLQLPKRESKLTVQAALLHDVERHCAYLFKPAEKNVLSINAIKEIESHRSGGVAYHETTLTVMHQYRELFGGGGFPTGAKGRYEENPLGGISRMSRVVSIACGFSEYLLKRQDKLPLPLPAIRGLMAERSGRDFDPDILSAFLGDMETTKPRRMTATKSSSEDEDDDGDL